jgi:hypothetical protein
MNNDGDLVRDLRMEIAALRRIIDGSKSRVAMAMIYENETKSKMARFLTSAGSFYLFSNNRRFQVAVCGSFETWRSRNY